MSVSPYVKFNFENNNVVETTPLMGVSCILTRTTKGPYNDPSKVIQSYTQFQREFGEEEMEDGSVSNVRKALELGSKLRIIRVLYGNRLEPGTIGEGNLTSALITVNGQSLVVKPKITANADEVYSLSITATNSNSYTGYNYSISDKDGNMVESGVLIRYKSASGDELSVLDYNSVSSFISNSSILEPADKSAYQKFIQFISTLDNSSTALEVSVTPGNYSIVPNSEPDEAEPTPENFTTALNTLLDYTDVYQVSFSQLHKRFGDNLAEETNPLGTNYLEVYRQAAEIIKPLQEYTLYIEVPKSNTTVSQINSWVDTVMGTLGNSKYIAYFAGGIKYYNDLGSLADCDCIGTILGLGDASATNYGPWKSFAGMNRGVIWDGHGPVCPNYGSPSKYDELNQLAENFVNMIVVKDTASSGKQTMLWHLFTSQIKQDSERFLSIVRLNLYLKKTLRPILENYLEEPNTWGTWKSIYLRVKPILDSLIDQQAMTEYTWMGDQNATSYDSLTVNNEADVRQGKYKVILKYKEVVPMQEITINITIDAASQSVSIDSDSSNA